LLSEFGGKAGRELSQEELRERFPSPVFGTGPGEYTTLDEYEAAKCVVQWAREQASQLAAGERLH
jgi:hypothetical protein